MEIARSVLGELRGKGADASLINNLRQLEDGILGVVIGGC